MKYPAPSNMKLSKQTARQTNKDPVQNLIKIESQPPASPKPLSSHKTTHIEPSFTSATITTSHFFDFDFPFDSLLFPFPFLSSDRLDPPLRELTELHGCSRPDSSIHLSME